MALLLAYTGACSEMEKDGVLCEEMLLRVVYNVRLAPCLFGPRHQTPDTRHKRGETPDSRPTAPPTATMQAAVCVAFADD
jgi:hypothetical protein